MLRYLFLLALGLALLKPAQAQREPVDASYRIRVAAFEKPFNMAIFDNLRELGHLQVEQADNGFTRVYLGMYLGLPTAQLMLKQVQKRGHKGAYLVVDETRFMDLNGELMSHSYQVLAQKKHDMAQVIALLRNTEAGMMMDFRQLYVQYKNGFYCYSLGIYNPNGQDGAEELATYTRMATQAELPKAFSRQIRFKINPSREERQRAAELKKTEAAAMMRP